ncbi:hypothetical protein EYF80_022080 [Liparis tanakae]|uniref:Uncharacterized protein n=1 Tax=Liparis tanakae TaxID=230148 RepID=A0A4Z2HR29_9TELE|nr:hypothetical protein EYF80_022080 [Liparis tanakae]
MVCGPVYGSFAVALGRPATTKRMGTLCSRTLPIVRGMQARSQLALRLFARDARRSTTNERPPLEYPEEQMRQITFEEYFTKIT